MDKLIEKKLHDFRMKCMYDSFSGNEFEIANYIKNELEKILPDETFIIYNTSLISNKSNNIKIVIYTKDIDNYSFGMIPSNNKKLIGISYNIY